MNARQLAIDALVRVEDGGFANLVVPALLDQSALAERDRAFVTELVYGTTRMRRACDWLVARHLTRPFERLDPAVRAALRLGAYQLAFLHTPPHAAVSATVDATPAPARGLVNAVLRKVAPDAADPPWPDDATRLSYPDWVVERLTSDLGSSAARAALAEMDRAAEVSVRPDGYVQDRASQWVGELVGAQPGERVADLCAAPGGKTTAMAHAGAHVVALDVHESRAGLVTANARRLRVADRVDTIVADARTPPLRAASFDRVLVDAPCSGLGVLRRRPDARWRVAPDDVEALAALQRELLDAAVTLLKPGGQLIYSVCTLTDAETVDVDKWFAHAHPDIDALPSLGPPWVTVGRGARLLPQTEGTDGMYVLVGRLAAP